MTTDDLILQTLRNSTLTEELRDTEIEALAGIITVHEYKKDEFIVQPGDSKLRNALMILATGQVEATATMGGEKATLHLLQPGDLAGIITFVGDHGGADLRRSSADKGNNAGQVAGL